MYNKCIRIELPVVTIGVDDVPEEKSHQSSGFSWTVVAALTPCTCRPPHLSDYSWCRPKQRASTGCHYRLLEAMPFENFRGLHADRFLNSPGTDACICSGQANLLLFAVGEVSLTPHIHPLLSVTPWVGLRCYSCLHRGSYRSSWGESQRLPFYLVGPRSLQKARLSPCVSHYRQ